MLSIWIQSVSEQRNAMDVVLVRCGFIASEQYFCTINNALHLKGNVYIYLLTNSYRIAIQYSLDAEGEYEFIQNTSTNINILMYLMFNAQFIIIHIGIFISHGFMPMLYGIYQIGCLCSTLF